MLICLSQKWNKPKVFSEERSELIFWAEDVVIGMGRRKAQWKYIGRADRSFISFFYVTVKWLMLMLMSLGSNIHPLKHLSTGFKQKLIKQIHSLESTWKIAWWIGYVGEVFKRKTWFHFELVTTSKGNDPKLPKLHETLTQELRQNSFLCDIASVFILQWVESILRRH